MTDQTGSSSPTGGSRPNQTRLLDGEPHGVRGARGEPPGLRPTWVEVDLDALRDNVAALKAHAVAPRLMAVVKADGYGHGLVPSARAALAGGADWLAVALAEEGVALREAGIDAPVLVMAEPPVPSAHALLDHGLTPAAYTPRFVATLDRLGRERGRPVAVHLKLDTGMRRLGVPPADWEDACRVLRSSSGVRVEAVWSHLAVADEPDHPFTTEQGEVFARGLELLRAQGLAPDLVHLCNSAGTLIRPDLHYDMVRPGISVYGLEPASGVTGGVTLRPALAWYARLSLVKRLAEGEAVSYGLRWSASEPVTVGTVPAGYADGVRRALSNQGTVLVGGLRIPVVGTVCMDQFMVLLRDLPAVAGDEVCLIGEQDGVRVTADDWAAWLGTINYEVVCGIGARVPRVYLGGGS